VFGMTKIEQQILKNWDKYHMGPDSQASAMGMSKETISAILKRHGRKARRSPWRTGIGGVVSAVDGLNTGGNDR
jgi:hypothetical protein